MTGTKICKACKKWLTMAICKKRLSETAIFKICKKKIHINKADPLWRFTKLLSVKKIGKHLKINFFDRSSVSNLSKNAKVNFSSGSVKTKEHKENNSYQKCDFSINAFSKKIWNDLSQKFWFSSFSAFKKILMANFELFPSRDL